MVVEAHCDDTAVERLRGCARAVETSAHAIRDWIGGDVNQPNGGVYVTHIVAAAQDVLIALGRLSNTLDKAALQVSARAGGAYLDFKGEQVDATVEVRKLAGLIKAAGADLMVVHDRYAPLVPKLGSIGQR